MGNHAVRFDLPTVYYGNDGRQLCLARDILFPNNGHGNVTALS